MACNCATLERGGRGGADLPFAAPCLGYYLLHTVVSEQPLVVLNSERKGEDQGWGLLLGCSCEFYYLAGSCSWPAELGRLGWSTEGIGATNRAEMGREGGRERVVGRG